MNVIEAFCIALKDHLMNNKYQFTEIETKDDGCDTCGYGATKIYALDIDNLMKEIDQFSKTFKDQ